jgi:hypothetical protein
LLTWDGGGGGRGAKSFDGEKAWSSVNHSVLCWWGGAPNKQPTATGPVLQREKSLILWFPEGRLSARRCCLYLSYLCHGWKGSSK